MTSTITAGPQPDGALLAAQRYNSDVGPFIERFETGDSLPDLDYEHRHAHVPVGRGRREHVAVAIRPK